MDSGHADPLDTDGATDVVVVDDIAAAESVLEKAGELLPGIEQLNPNLRGRRPGWIGNVSVAFDEVAAGGWDYQEITHYTPTDCYDQHHHRHL